MLAADDLAAYLARLGVDPEPPSAEALDRLHRAHVERVPYETAWIHMGERWGVDSAVSAQRIARTGRGGYCFHLNGGLSELLVALGYEVRLHRGGVHGPAGTDLEVLGNHLVLTVHGLPHDTNPSGDWFVDAGLGDALHEPMPLVAGEYAHGPFRYVFAPDELVDGWHLTHDPRGSFPGMAFRGDTASIDDFAGWNEHLSTSPDSGFVKTFVVQRRDAMGADMLRGLRLRRLEHEWIERDLTSKDEWLDAIADVFGLDLRRAGDDAARAALWERVKASHDAWLASQA